MPVAELTDVTAVCTGGNHMLAVRRDGTVWAWGHNHEGQLGDGTAMVIPFPIRTLLP
jgi:alpha-tubulin suppressor-like RCC1 family protein